MAAALAVSRSRPPAPLLGAPPSLHAAGSQGIRPRSTRRTAVRMTTAQKSPSGTDERATEWSPLRRLSLLTGHRRLQAILVAVIS
jgi:hypothetical protein